MRFAKAEEEEKVEISFGSWLKKRRRVLDLTQDELAEQVGCSTQTIRKIEAGVRRPSREIAELLADSLGIEADERPAFIQLGRAEAQNGAAGGVRGDLPTDRQDDTLPPARRTAPSLVQSPTPFVGRKAELKAIVDSAGDPQRRLITIVGPGGIGKTRLAIAAAIALGEHATLFADGIHYVSLAPVSSSAGMVNAIADALNIPLPGLGNAESQLLNYLRDKELFLVLDNMEHLIDGASLLAAIIEEAPAVKMLVTSRERLNVRAEWLFELHGLRIPEAGQANHLEDYSATALFLQSARRTHATFTPTPDEQHDIVRICKLLDGLPLGIELAAAWVRVLSPAEIAHEIEHSISFLTTSLRDVPERHRSLQAVFDYSWDLLSAAEQVVLERLSVFCGGFTREAAFEVAGASLLVLSGLVDKSLLRRLEPQAVASTTAPSAARRYDLHELVRQYAAARLSAGPAPLAAADQHCAYYCNLLAKHEARLKGAGQMEAVAELSAEIENLRVAWERAVTHKQVDYLRQSTRALSCFYELRLWFEEGARVFGRAAQSLERDLRDGRSDAASTITQGLLLTHQAWFVARKGQYGPAKELVERSLALVASHDAPEALMDGLVCSGMIAHIMGDYAEAHESLERGLALARERGDNWWTILGLGHIGGVEYSLGHYAEARRWLSEAVDLARAVGHPRGSVFSLAFLSMIVQARREYDEAQDLLRESLILASEISDSWGIGTALNGLGLLAQAQGEYSESQYLFREALRLYREIGDSWMTALALNHLADATSALGDAEEARRIYREALQIATDAQTVPIALDALVGLALRIVSDGDAARAMELLTHVHDHPAASKLTQDRAGTVIGRLAGELASDVVADARSRAKAQRFEVLARETLRQGS